jgi:hypothetical protein
VRPDSCMLSSLFTAFSLLFRLLIEQELSGLGVRWVVRTSVRTCVLCDWCLLKCLNTSSNTGGRPDASSGRSDGHNRNCLCKAISALEFSLTFENCIFLILVTLNLSY